MSPSVGSFRGIAWGSSSFFHLLTPSGFCFFFFFNMGRFSNLRVTLAQGPCQPSLYRSSMGYVLPKRALPSDVCSQKLWGLSFLALEPSAPGPGVGLGLLTPEISLPNFYPPHVGEGPASCFFLHSTSLNPLQPFSLPLSSLLKEYFIRHWGYLNYL